MTIHKNLFSSLHRLWVRSRYWLRFGLLIILMGVLVVACQGSPEQHLASQSSATETENCRVVEHEAGETEICGQPQTVAALEARTLDPLLALGVQPAAHTVFYSVDFQLPVLGHRLTTQSINLGTSAAPSLETLVEVNPDLIVAEIWQDYEVFSKIAPTLVLDSKVGKEGWSRRLQIVAQAVGKEEQAKQVIAEYEQQLAEAREKLAPVVAAYPHVLPILDYNHQGIFNIYSYESLIADLLEEVGFELVLLDGFPRETPNSPGPGGPISIETLVQFDPDIIIVSALRKDNYDNSVAVAQQKWEENPLLQKMRAVQAGRIRFVDFVRLGNGIEGVIASKVVLDLLPEMLLPFVEEE
jgi:iron complex transport system substrate-binding protein